MPPIGQAIVMENLADERRHLAVIEAHIDRLTGQGIYDVDRIDREGSEGCVPSHLIRRMTRMDNSLVPSVSSQTNAAHVPTGTYCWVNA